MADQNPEEVTLNTLPEDLKDGFAGQQSFLDDEIHEQRIGLQ
jgi:hypothetical protein